MRGKRPSLNFCLRLSESNQPKKLKDYVPKAGSKYAMDWDDYHDHDTLNDFIGVFSV